MLDVSGSRIAGYNKLLRSANFAFGRLPAMCKRQKRKGRGREEKVSEHLWRYTKPNYVISNAVQSVLSSVSHGGIWQKLMKLMRCRYIFRSPLKLSVPASKSNVP